MSDFPAFPVDPETLDLLSHALDPDESSERSSVGDFLDFMSQMGGSDTTAVESIEWGDPLGIGESCEIHHMRDAAYHEHDVIRALVVEVRRLRHDVETKRQALADLYAVHAAPDPLEPPEKP